MNEFLRKRIERLLESLPEEHQYEVADYLEFLAGKYGTRSDAATPFQRLAETVEDTLRKGRVSATVIKSTMDAMGSAGRMMSGLAAAGKAVVDEVSTAINEGTRPPGGPAPTPPPPASGEASSGPSTPPDPPAGSA